MDKTSQIVLDTLLGKIKEKEAEYNSYVANVRKTKREIDELYKAVKQFQGRKRGLRSDKGKKRGTGKAELKPLRKSIKFKVKRGRIKQNGLLATYDKNGTFLQNIVFAISSAKRFLHNREIAEILYKYDQSVSIDTLVERLSARVSRYKKDGSIVGYLVGGNFRNTVYGLPQWLDEDNDIKHGYEYSGKYLDRKQTSFVNQTMLL